MTTHHTTRRGALQLALVAMLASSAIGCGDLSNGDLLFLAGLPKKHEVELSVDNGDTAGALTSSQALTADALGEPAGMYQSAVDIATGVNTGVGDILDFIDSLGRGHPPTERTDDARIWGPIHDVDGRGITFRLEIRREERDDGGPRFLFCFQVGRDDEIISPAPTCGEPNGNGYVTLIGGFFEPRTEDGGARSGSGEVFLDFDASQELGTAEDDTSGVITLTYDFSQGGEAKAVDVDIVAGLNTGSTPTTIAYHYNRTLDGFIDFAFKVEDAPPDPNRTGGNASDLDIVATWSVDGIGRADVSGNGGELRPDQHVRATECWDVAHNQTYLYWAVFSGTTEELKWEEGDLTACP